MKKSFVNGRMNLDIDNRLLEDGDYREATNIEVVNSEGSDVGAIENSLSNKKLTSIDFGANPIEIGKYEDEFRDNLYWFVKSDTGTFLIEWDETNKVSSTVLKDTRTEDVDRVLNIKEDFLITGIVKVLSEDPEKDLLMWTDNNMNICCINISRAKTWGENNFEEEDIFLIKKQPKFAPKITPTYSSEESNYLEEIFMSFGYRYKYLDGERSAVSTYSNYNFNPGKFKMDYQSMENIGMVNAFNAARITFDTGPKQVTDIEIISKQSNSNNLYLITSFNKEEEGWADDVDKNYVFSNNKIYQILAEKELYRTFDNVPRKAKALTLTENIPTIGNYVEGYDIVDEDDNSIKMDYTIDVKSNDVSGEELSNSIGATETTFTFTIPTTIELNQNTRLIFNLDLGNSLYDGEYLDTLEYILTEDFDNAAGLAANDDFKFFIGTILTAKFITEYDIDVDDAWTLSSNIPFSVSGSTTTTITIKAITLVYTVDDTPNDPGDNPTNTHTENLLFKFNSGSSAFFSNVETVSSCKTNREYEVGIIYQDKWGRKSTVLTSLNNTIYIPQELSTLQNKLLININHNAPYWADSYKLVVKSDALQYQTIYATVYYPDGVYRWVKLEGANRDKVKEGDTLIVKSDLNGPITSLIKTRVLEVVNKEKDFIEGNTDSEDNDIIEESGLHMKIKPSGYDMSYSENAIINIDQVRSAGKNRQEKFINENILEAFFGDEAKRTAWKNSTGNNDLKKPAVVIKDFNSYSEDGTFENAIEIVAGSKINIFLKVAEDGNGPEFNKEYIVASTYDNIKDWWEEEVVDLGSVDDEFDLNFEEVGGEVRILIQGDNTGSPASKKQSVLTVVIDAILVEGLVVFETETKQSEDFKFYETEQTFEIIDGKHQGNSQNQTSSLPAIIDLDFFNCYVQGNGVESFRIKDAANSNFLNIDLKPTATSIEKYKETRRFADLTYGEGYVEETNMNGLNVFNTSQLNFKLLEKQNGPIQFLFTRDRNIVVWQGDKAGYVLFGRDLLTMANGDTVLSGTPEILGEYVPYQGENGCGENPESIAWDSYRFYYVNPKMGTPIRLSIDGTSEINYGMVNFFRELFINNPSSKKLGGYDPYHKKYVLSTEDEDLTVFNAYCGNTITKDITEAFTYILNLNNLSGEVSLNYNITSGNATIQAVFDNDISVLSNVTGSGVLTFDRDNLNVDTATITVTPITDSATIQLTNNCPVGSAMKLITIVTNDEGDIGDTIINRFKKASGTYYGGTHYFELAPVSEFTVESGTEGVGKFPSSGETITLQSFKDTLSTAFFNEAQLNRLGYLVSSTLYTQAQINTILAAASYLSITKNIVSANSETNTGSFVFNRPNSNENLYLIFDYEDKNEAPIAVADSVSVNKGDSVIINVLDNDSDPDGDDLTVIIVTQPLYGTAVLNANGTITYSHNGSDNLTDIITYKVNDGNEDSNTVSVDISVGVDCSAGITASGGIGIYEAIIVLGTGLGSSGISYNAYSIPDRFQIEYDGVIVADSKFVGSGITGDPSTYNVNGNNIIGTHEDLPVYGFNGVSFDATGENRTVTVVQNDIANGTTEPRGGVGSITFNKTTATPTTMKIIITAPIGSTSWNLSGICPSNV
ncbi:virion structural protein [Cellulophaga phage phi13:2]|uniref:Structural protein n=1 Tax=Cellulophaga phage phi13:2 TaxID=1328030 RepID=S0A4L9_9CAUD|nr:virion structural protein [Cellulophaga phage phi13:2]AGO49730.1 structural protein [Cellulophaga phage phi13:2]